MQADLVVPFMLPFPFTRKILLLLLLSLSPLFRVFTITYLKQNHVSRVYSVVGVLYLQFMLQVMLLRPWNMVCTFTLALSVVCVQCLRRLFLQFL